MPPSHRLVTWAAAALLGASLAPAEEPASQYSPLAQIQRDNVKDLKVAWTFHTGEPLAPATGAWSAQTCTPRRWFTLCRASAST